MTNFLTVNEPEQPEDKPEAPTKNIIKDDWDGGIIFTAKSSSTSIFLIYTPLTNTNTNTNVNPLISMRRRTK